MGRTNKKYDEDFKINIVKLIENGKAISEIVCEYGISRSLVYAWKEKFGTITTSEGTITCNNDIIKLQKENRLLKEENEILKKAMAIFTKR